MNQGGQMEGRRRGNQEWTMHIITLLHTATSGYYSGLFLVKSFRLAYEGMYHIKDVCI